MWFFHCVLPFVMQSKIWCTVRKFKPQYNIYLRSSHHCGISTDCVTLNELFSIHVQVLFDNSWTLFLTFNQQTSIYSISSVHFKKPHSPLMFNGLDLADQGSMWTGQFQSLPPCDFIFTCSQIA